MKSFFFLLLLWLKNYVFYTAKMYNIASKYTKMLLLVKNISQKIENTSQ